MKIFAVEVESGHEGKDGELAVGPVYRNLLSKDGFPSADDNISTSWAIFSNSVEKNPGNRMLGWREMVDGKPGPYEWKTYMEVYDEVMKVGSALRASGAEPGSRIGIYGANSPQWIIAMQACSAQSLICVPLYDTLGPGAVNFITEHAEINIVIAQDKKVEQVLNSECTSSGRIKLIVCFTTFKKEDKYHLEQIGMKHCSWNEFLQMGKDTPEDLVTPKPLDICSIMYTSGTSGDPKGVVLTHENVATFVRGMDLFMDQFEDKMTVDDAYLSFLPLAHILDRVIEEYFFHKGASVGYFHGDINALSEDLMALRPTYFAGVPRVFERVHEGVLKALDELRPLRRMIFHLLYKYKLSMLKMGYKHKEASPLADFLAFRKVKAKLGGRVRLITSGGAPLSEKVEEFLRVTSCAFMTQGYGLTESCGLSTLTYPDEISMAGTVGVPSVFSELRLKEVPEMGYNPLGNSPRGEICIKGKTVFSGYHKNPELTKEVFKDGWFHTGDIGEILPNGAVKIIDRKKNIFKLSQGEYVAVEYLEKIYGFPPIIEDIWVYGDSFKSMLVAVVVPHEGNTMKWASSNGYQGSFSELCKLDKLRDYILLELKSTAEKNKLRGFEHIKGVLLDPLPLIPERELVTATMKKRRDRLLKHYKAGIDNLYQNLTKEKR